MKRFVNWLKHLMVLSFVALWSCSPARSAESGPAPAPAPAAKSEENSSQETLRSYLQLQQQLHATELAIERNRKEAELAAARTAEALATRLQAIEETLAVQRAKELDVMQSANRVMLIVAGSFAGMGFLALLLMAYFQWRTVHRLAEFSTNLPRSQALGPVAALPALGPGEAPQVMVGPSVQSNQELLGALDKLQKRIHELEHSAQSSLPDNGVGGNGEPGAAEGKDATSDPEAARIQGMLGKGQSLLSLDNVEGALACFDEVLAIKPGHTEALLKKGTALERLRKLDEAIACYDQAIAADSSLTIAYLHKGGLFNRMERFDEALACYEQALRTQEKGA